MVRVLFRNPIFPLLIGSDVKVFGVRSLSEIDELLNLECFQGATFYDVIDSSGEGWSLMPGIEVLSPLTVNKIWSKQKIIDFYNASLALSQRFERKGLSNVRLSKLVQEIVIYDGKL